MHELGIALEVARIAGEEARARGAARVLALRLRVGAWSGVEPESLRFALETLTLPGGESEDLLAGARIELELVPAEFLCPTCGARYGAAGYFDPCPGCGALGAELVGGRELSLAELEVDEG